MLASPKDDPREKARTRVDPVQPAEFVVVNQRRDGEGVGGRGGEGGRVSGADGAHGDGDPLSPRTTRRGAGRDDAETTDTAGLAAPVARAVAAAALEAGWSGAATVPTGAAAVARPDGRVLAAGPSDAHDAWAVGQPGRAALASPKVDGGALADIRSILLLLLLASAAAPARSPLVRRWPLS